MDLQFVEDGPYDPKFVALAKCQTGVGTQGAGDLGEVNRGGGRPSILKASKFGPTAYPRHIQKSIFFPREASFYPTAYPQGISS